MVVTPSTLLAGGSHLSALLGETRKLATPIPPPRRSVAMRYPTHSRGFPTPRSLALSSAVVFLSLFTMHPSAPATHTCVGAAPPQPLGTSASETIDGTAGNDVILGLGGNDIINGM